MTPIRKTRPILPPPSWCPTLTTLIPDVYMRPLKPSDLADLHELRTQPEVMIWTSKGRVDADLDETRAWLGLFLELEPKSEFESVQQPKQSSQNLDGVVFEDAYATHESRSINEPVSTTGRNSSSPGVEADIERKKDGTTTTSTTTTLGQRKSSRFNLALVYDPIHNQHASTTTKPQVIGVIGCHHIEPEAEIGYMIRREFWGQRITTAAMKVYLDLWWSLDREVVSVHDLDDDPDLLGVSWGVSEESSKSRSGGPAITATLDKNDDYASMDVDNFSMAVSGNCNNVLSEENGITILPESLKAVIEVTNFASIRLLQRYGFQYESCITVEENGKHVELSVYYLRQDMSARFNA